MELKRLERNWERFAKTDPMWAILTLPDKRGGLWSEEEFFATGELEIGHIMQALDDRGIQVPRSSALDFGCGIGRLTHALAARFDRVTGVDIAPTMIELARQHNRSGDRVAYIQNSENLLPFPDNSFNLIYTSLVLQHIRPASAMAYIAEFIRIITPDGVAVFHLPEVRHEPAGSGATAATRRAAFRAKARLEPALRRLTAPLEVLRPRMEMNAVRRERVQQFVADHGGEVVAAVGTGRAEGFSGLRYFVRRCPTSSSANAPSTS